MVVMSAECVWLLSNLPEVHTLAAIMGRLWALEKGYYAAHVWYICSCRCVLAEKSSISNKLRAVSLLGIYCILQERGKLGRVMPWVIKSQEKRNLVGFYAFRWHIRKKKPPNTSPRQLSAQASQHHPQPITKCANSGHGTLRHFCTLMPTLTITV
jgi:hypothetical protein